MFENINYDVVTSIICIALFVVFLAVLFYFGKKKEARRIIYGLVISAEKRFGNGQGELKYESVIGALYPKLPVIVLIFLTEKEIDKMIEEGVSRLKEYFKDNPDQIENFYKKTEYIE